MRYLSHTTFLGAAFCYCLVNGCDLPDLDKHAVYATYGDAESDGAIQRGWIRAFVPHSAKNIQESHNLDSNSQWLTFEFDPADRGEMVRQLHPISDEEVKYPNRSATRERIWWPKDLSTQTVSSKNKYDFYTDRYTAFVALERDAPRAWYWDPR